MRKFLVWLVLLLLLVIVPSQAYGMTKRKRNELRRLHNQLGTEMRSKREECMSKLRSGQLEPGCSDSEVAGENCVLRCLSGPCYTLLYGEDPLEEGEIDTVRGPMFVQCWKDPEKFEKSSHNWKRRQADGEHGVVLEHMMME